MYKHILIFNKMRTDVYIIPQIRIYMILLFNRLFSLNISHIAVQACS